MTKEPSRRSGLAMWCKRCRFYYGRRIVELHGPDCQRCGGPLDRIEKKE